MYKRQVVELLAEHGAINGVKTYSGAVYHARAVILCTGTYPVSYTHLDVYKRQALETILTP